MSLWDDSWGYGSPGQTADRDRIGTQSGATRCVNTEPLLDHHSSSIRGGGLMPTIVASGLDGKTPRLDRDHSVMVGGRP